MSRRRRTSHALHVEHLEARIVLGYFSADPIDETPLPLQPSPPFCPTGPPIAMSNLNGGQGQTAYTQAPVRDFDGMPVISTADLQDSTFGFAWGQTRS